MNNELNLKNLYQNFQPDWRLIWKLVQKLTSQHGYMHCSHDNFFSNLACANKILRQTLSNYFPNFPSSSFFLRSKALMEWWIQARKPTLTDMKIHLGFRAYRRGQLSKINISKVVWLFNITSFFIPMKMCCLKLRLALVSCQYLDYSMNGSHLRQCLKSWVNLLGKDYQHF